MGLSDKPMVDLFWSKINLILSHFYKNRKRGMKMIFKINGKWYRLKPQVRRAVNNFFKTIGVIVFILVMSIDDIQIR